jgi:hypothetical protein
MAVPDNDEPPAWDSCTKAPELSSVARVEQQGGEDEPEHYSSATPPPSPRRRRAGKHAAKEFLPGHT